MGKISWKRRKTGKSRDTRKEKRRRNGKRREGRRRRGEGGKKKIDNDKLEK